MAKAPTLVDILKDMKQKYESPVNKIKRDGKDYGHMMPIRNLRTRGSVGVKSIMFSVDVTGSKGDIYPASIQFREVEFSKDKKGADWELVKIEDKEEPTGFAFWYYKKPSMLKNPVAVRCECGDFQFRWEYWLYQAKALIGNWEKYNPPGGVKTRPPVNPNGALGVCKHLYSLAEALKNMNLIVG